MKIYVLVVFAVAFLAIIENAQGRGKRRNRPKSPKNFDEFRQKMGRRYKSREVAERRAIFERNKANCDAQNDRYVAKQSKWACKLNDFADRNEEELKAHLGLDPSKETSKVRGRRQRRNKNSKPPPRTGGRGRRSKRQTAVSNWITSGQYGHCAPDVGNQGSCGSCYMWAALKILQQCDCIYGQTSTKPDISYQDLIDCDPYTNGCSGGFYSTVWTSVYRRGDDLLRTSDYAYVASEQSCKKSQYDLSTFTYTIDQHWYESGENGIMANLAYGCVAVAVDANYQWFSYDSGVFECTNPSGVNHAVIVCGHGTEDGQDYWLVQNSWGTGWGEGGYMKLRRGVGACNVNIYGGYQPYNCGGTY